MKILITGGIKSGKSTFAEKKTLEILSNFKPIYLATAEIIDSEMINKVKNHKKRRKNKFVTIEEPIDILKQISNGKEVVLIECMTMWLNNWLHYKKSTEEIPKIINQILSIPRDIVFVINDVGKGIIPNNKLSRLFVELSGIISSQIGNKSDEIWYCISGYPVKIK